MWNMKSIANFIQFTSTIAAKTRSGKVARSTNAIRHCSLRAIIKVAIINVVFWMISEMRSPIAPLTVVASADSREEIWPLLFSSMSNQATSFLRISAKEKAQKE